MNTITDFLQRMGPVMIRHTHEHILLVFMALTIAIGISLPLGIYLTRSRWKKLADLALGGAGVIQTIPALALIAIIMLLFALLKLPTIGAPPAMLALVLYALLPILRNTYTSIRQVDPAIKEVAKGMGMRDFQILMSVELPLSLPVIMAGVRISTVWTIGIATLCTLIGAGGLGDPIFRGISNYNMRLLIAGTLPAAALALIADALLGWIEKWLTPEGIRSRESSK